MTICYFGNYNPEYARNRILIRGLKESGVEVIECREQADGLRLFINLIKKYYRLPKYDTMIVGYSDSRWIMILGRLLCRQRLFWDAFYSLYDSWVFDRRLAGRYSLRAVYYWLMDWLCCRLSDKVLLDTDEHIKYFVKTFKIKKDKFIRIFVGSDNSIFHPRENNNQKENYFLAHFHGKFIPLQGVKYIIKAAKIMESGGIKLKIIGSGQEYKNIRAGVDNLKINNIEWHERVNYEELPNFISKADICLGIFGDSGKTKRVIPNKVFEAIAMAKPVITGDTPAARELFTDRENILFCRVADAEDLAAKILELKNNQELRKKIAIGGHEIFKKYCTPKIIAEKLLKDLS